MVKKFFVNAAAMNKWMHQNGIIDFLDCKDGFCWILSLHTQKKDFLQYMKALSTAGIPAIMWNFPETAMIRQSGTIGKLSAQILSSKKQ